MKKLIWLFSALILHGCSHTYYVANTQNIPLFTEKNEARISGGYGESQQSKAYELQGAYAVSQHIGIMANFTSFSGKISQYSSWKGIYIDGAAGYFKPLGAHGVFETYSGIGIEHQDHNYSLYDYPGPELSAGKARLTSMKFFIQPSLGLKINWLELAISSRFGTLNFSRVTNTINTTLEEHNIVDRISDKIYYLFEPAMTLRAGIKNVKVQIQAAKIFTNSKSFDREYISLGLVGSFRNKKK